MVTAPRAMAAMTPGEISREGAACGVEVEVEEAVCCCCGARSEVAPRSVGVVVLVSRSGTGTTTEVASGVVSVRIVWGRSVEGLVCGEMVRSEAWIFKGIEPMLSSVVVVVEVEMGVGEGVEMTEPRLFSLTASSSMANAGHKLVFEGSASGTMEMVNARPERTPSAALGTTSGESVVWYGIQVYVPVFSMEAGYCAKVRKLRFMRHNSIGPEGE